MQVYVTCSCGHEELVNVYGPQRERDAKIRWYESTPCHDCWQKETVEAFTRYRGKPLPDLTGSEKQVNWATDIRISAMGVALRSKNTKEKAIVDAMVSRETTAKFWIDSRRELKETPHGFLAAYANVLKERNPMNYENPADLEMARQTLGLTLSEMAEILGVQERTLRRWISGERPIRPDSAALVGELMEEHDDVVGAIIEEYTDAANDAEAWGEGEIVAHLRLYRNQGDFEAGIRDGDEVESFRLYNSVVRDVASKLRSMMIDYVVEYYDPDNVNGVD